MSSEKDTYTKAVNDFVNEYHNHLCKEKCNKEPNNDCKCTYWFYAIEVATKLLTNYKS